MPVTKFRTFEEARRALWIPKGDPRLDTVIPFVWGLALDMAGPCPFPRGVTKFRSIGEANADREKWEKLRKLPTKKLK